MGMEAKFIYAMSNEGPAIINRVRSWNNGMRCMSYYVLIN